MSDQITSFKVTEKALLIQAVTFNEWSLAMIDQMIDEMETNLMQSNQPVEEDGLEKMLLYLEQRGEVTSD
ncbi:MAG: hypothetical protein KA314_19290 [Chloroflexi bacterium]|nr:hypothetical protein [Chloroflexota bacterium]MBP8057978.1 hypothetical protein [Chloroflexota bacterium]